MSARKTSDCQGATWRRRWMVAHRDYGPVTGRQHLTIRFPPHATHQRLGLPSGGQTGPKPGTNLVRQSVRSHDGPQCLPSPASTLTCLELRGGDTLGLRLPAAAQLVRPDLVRICKPPAVSVCCAKRRPRRVGSASVFLPPDLYCVGHRCIPKSESPKSGGSNMFASLKDAARMRPLRQLGSKAEMGMQVPQNS
jgi:hypothetical protein